MLFVEKNVILSATPAPSLQPPVSSGTTLVVPTSTHDDIQAAGDLSDHGSEGEQDDWEDYVWSEKYQKIRPSAEDSSSDDNASTLPGPAGTGTAGAGVTTRGT
jgi:hypothetical protein